MTAFIRLIEVYNVPSKSRVPIGPISVPHAQSESCNKWIPFVKTGKEDELKNFFSGIWKCRDATLEIVGDEDCIQYYTHVNFKYGRSIRK